MKKFTLVFCFAFNLIGLGATATSYKGSITFPFDLYTLEGARIPKGKHTVEIGVEKKQYLLSLYSEGKMAAVIRGAQVPGGLFTLPATVPIVGTHYLRSSADPLQTAQERQFSKTGLPQYAEETRDWKATLRVYKTSTGSVFAIFQVLEEGGKCRRVDFELSLNQVQQKQ